jgi:formamidopyrimidine-DNA glycosylase
MPELPEVEIVARQLARQIVGARIQAVAVHWPRVVAHPDVATFVAELPGAQILAVMRRAKYLLLQLDGDRTLLVHRRMSGNLLLIAPDEQDTPAARDPYCRVSLALDDQRELRFSDPRKFGRMALWSNAELPQVFSVLGPEPLDPAFTPPALAARLHGHRRAIKAVLLDQAIVAGLGNIYADEALFAAGIHPLRPADALTPAEIARLWAAMRAVLTAGIASGGTSFGRHRDVWGQAGSNLRNLAVYRRGGEPCVTCGTPITRIVRGGRGTHFCPHCQPAAGETIAVAGTLANIQGA